MTLSEFIKKYDFEGSIVLLEGKRNVLESDKEKLTELGRLLASKTNNMTFRSGNADGADQYFSEGVASVDSKRLQVVTPYSGHRTSTNYAFDTINLDELDIVAEPEVIYQSKSNKKTEKLIDKYVSGEKNRVTLKAAYIIRDTIKAIGTKDIKPATFAIFYEDLENPKTGGTGHTMNVCEQNNIPIINQTVWFNWLAENDKFKDVGIEEDTKLILSLNLKFGEFDVLFQKWIWDGIEGESLIFCNDDIKHLSDEEVAKQVEESELIRDQLKCTIGKNEKYTFINFNFVSN